MGHALTTLIEQNREHSSKHDQEPREARPTDTKTKDSVDVACFKIGVHHTKTDIFEVISLFSHCLHSVTA